MKLYKIEFTVSGTATSDIITADCAGSAVDKLRKRHVMNTNLQMIDPVRVKSVKEYDAAIYVTLPPLQGPPQ